MKCPLCQRYMKKVKGGPLYEWLCVNPKHTVAQMDRALAEDPTLCKE